MNNLKSLRPVTRRSIHLFYVSPATCELAIPFSGSGSSVAANLDIQPVNRKAGPATLDAVSMGTDGVMLSWPSLSYAFAYAVYRALNPLGPFTLLTSNLLDTHFVDNTVSAGISYWYKVTGIEPDFGETFPSPLAGVTV
jgi:fibronectin type 3 domain-containing protein